MAAVESFDEPDPNDIIVDDESDYDSDVEVMLDDGTIVNNSRPTGREKDDEETDTLAKEIAADIRNAGPNTYHHYYTDAKGRTTAYGC